MPENKKKEFPVRTQSEFLSWSQSFVLMKFVEEGGEGIKSALVTILNMYAQNFSSK